MKQEIRQNIFSAGSQKLLAFPKHLSAWLADEPVTPIAVEIHPTERCNHNCPQCQSHFSIGRQKARQLARNGLELDLSLLSSFWRDPPQGVILSGHTGDPLLHSDIASLLRTLKKQKINTVLITNGQEMGGELPDLIVTTCMGIRISLDAYDSASFAKTHGVGEKYWKLIIENIQRLLEAREHHNVSRENCHIGIGYLTDRSTIPGMFAAARLARDIGVDYIQFRPFHYSEDDISGEINRWKYTREFSGFKVLISQQKYSDFHKFSRIYDKCHASNFYKVIDARGDIYVCCHQVGRQTALLGSLRRHSWQDILATNTRDLIKDICFPNENCVPFCRLHPHNTVLQSILETGLLPKAALTDTMASKHAAFL